MIDAQLAGGSGSRQLAPPELGLAFGSMSLRPSTSQFTRIKKILSR
jgi:hypothetical protein